MSRGIAMSAIDVWTVAQTLWGEARGEPEAGRISVAWVVRNRCEVHPRWAGMTPLAICRAPRQFSCWNPGDPNLPLLARLSLDDAVFCGCLLNTVEVFGGLVPTPVGHAIHYHVAGIPLPSWAQGHALLCQAGHHLFYQGIH